MKNKQAAPKTTTLSSPFYVSLVLKVLNRPRSESRNNRGGGFAWFNTDSEGMMLALAQLESESKVKWAGSGKGQVAYRLAK